jgi:diacylglycerol kinase
MSFIQKNINRLKFAGSGILFAVRTDFSFRWQVIAGSVMIVVVLALMAPLTNTELMFLLLSFTLILITELQNSALEAALDHLHPELHHNIGRSKDMAAGAVLLAGFFWIIVICFLLFARI